MFNDVRNWLWNNITDWLNATSKSNRNVAIINNFEDMQKDLQVADVVLFEGRSRVSEVIKNNNLITLDTRGYLHRPFRSNKKPKNKRASKRTLQW